MRAHECRDRNPGSGGRPATSPNRTARLLAALHQAAAEHRVDPDEVPALWDWIVEDGTRSTSEPRDCMWDWVVCEDSLSSPRRRAPGRKAEKGGLN